MEEVLGASLEQKPESQDKLRTWLRNQKDILLKDITPFFGGLYFQKAKIPKDSVNQKDQSYSVHNMICIRVDTVPGMFDHILTMSMVESHIWRGGHFHTHSHILHRAIHQ